MKPLVSLFLFVLVDVLGFSLVLPLFPYLASQFEMGPIEVGLLQASNALAQLIAVPFIGILSDKYGRRPLLTICVAGTLVSFILLGTAKSKFMLFFSRILDGFLGGNISLAQAYIAAIGLHIGLLTFGVTRTTIDVTTVEDRARGMGILGAAFGLGFIVGPAIGGTLCTYDYSYPSFVASALTFINLVAVYFTLPESLPVEKRNQSLVSSSSWIPTSDSLKMALMDPRLGTALWLRFIYGLVFTCFEMTFGFYTKLRLGVDARTSSYLLVAYGIFFSAVQAGGMRTLAKKYEDKGLMAATFGVLAGLYLVSGFTTAVWQHVVLLIPLGMASGISNSLVSSLVSKEVDPSLMGSTLGLSAALGSLTRVVSPAGGGHLIQLVSESAPAVACATLCVYLVYVARTLASIPKNQKISHKEPQVAESAPPTKKLA